MYTLSCDTRFYSSFVDALHQATRKAKYARKSVYILRDGKKVFHVRAPIEMVIDQTESRWRRFRNWVKS